MRAARSCLYARVQPRELVRRSPLTTRVEWMQSLHAWCMRHESPPLPIHLQTGPSTRTYYVVTVMLKTTLAAAVAPLVPRAIELTHQRNTQTPGRDDEEKRDAASLNVASGRRL